MGKAGIVARANCSGTVEISLQAGMPERGHPKTSLLHRNAYGTGTARWPLREGEAIYSKLERSIERDGFVSRKFSGSSP